MATFVALATATCSLSKSMLHKFALPHIYSSTQCSTILLLNSMLQSFAAQTYHTWPHGKYVTGSEKRDLNSHFPGIFNFRRFSNCHISTAIYGSDIIFGTIPFN